MRHKDECGANHPRGCRPNCGCWCHDKKEKPTCVVCGAPLKEGLVDPKLKGKSKNYCGKACMDIEDKVGVKRGYGYRKNQKVA